MVKHVKHSFNRLCTSFDNNLDNKNEGYPTSDRIMHDIKKKLISMKSIYEDNGIAIQDIGNREGI